MIVEAVYAEGLNMSLAQMFGSGPKWTIGCGDCRRGFQKRLPYHQNRPVVVCPHCGALNRINVQWTAD